MPALAQRVPRRRLPSWVVRSLLVDPVVRGRLFELDKLRPVSADKAKAQLSWTPRPTEEAIVDTADSLLAAGLVRS